MTYVFDNSATQARARLSALAEVHDPSTIQHLSACGVAEGWKCLEIGGGLGTIARWLSERVGPRGYVLTTDIDPRFLATLQLANVDVRRHDILVDPLPGDTFDIAHARLVLGHLPDPDRAIDRMIATLRPGGWLVIEDLEARSDHPESDDPLDRISKTTAALRQVALEAGFRGTLGPSLARRLRAKGLMQLGNEGSLQMCSGGTAAARLARLNFEQLRDAMLSTGTLTPEEFDGELARLADAEFAWRSPILWTAWGRRPEQAT